METVLITVWFFVSAIVVRANVYDMQAEQQKTVFIFERVDGQYHYKKIQVLNND